MDRMVSCTSLKVMLDLKAAVDAILLSPYMSFSCHTSQQLVSPALIPKDLIVLSIYISLHILILRQHQFKLYSFYPQVCGSDFYGRQGSRPLVPSEARLTRMATPSLHLLPKRLLKNNKNKIFKKQIICLTP